MAIKSFNVGFFDRFTRFGSFFKVYGSIGVLMVAIISILMSLLLIFSLGFYLGWRLSKKMLYPCG
jgi:hypothetical protein